MADIHVLPVQAVSSDISRMTTMLANAFAEGVDLGPRGHHIKSITRTLEAYVSRLHQMILALEDDPDIDVHVLEHLQEFILVLNREVTALSAAVQNLD